MVELFKLRLDSSMQQAETWFATEFQPGSWEELKGRYPVGGNEWRMLNMVLGYWEMLGAIIDHNLLSEDLLFDAMESMEITWAKVKEWLPSARTEMGPDLWENAELLIQRQHRWRAVRVPKSQRT
jgi:hypothetical protein